MTPANTDDACATLVVFGCTDDSYLEYDATANTDDGSCATLVVFGCTDLTACNYNESANTDDGSCFYVDGICDTCVGGILVDNDTDDDGICDADEIEGVLILTLVIIMKMLLTMMVHVYVDGICRPINGELIMM